MDSEARVTPPGQRPRQTLIPDEAQNCSKCSAKMFFASALQSNEPIICPGCELRLSMDTSNLPPTPGLQPGAVWTEVINPVFIKLPPQQEYFKCPKCMGKNTITSDRSYEANCSHCGAPCYVTGHLQSLDEPPPRWVTGNVNGKFMCVCVCVCVCV
jgi:hypothetical protein